MVQFSQSTTLVPTEICQQISEGRPLNVVNDAVKLTAVFLGQQRVEVQLQTDAVSCPDGSWLEEVLHPAVSGVQRLDGAPRGGVQLREVRGHTIPHQEDVEVPDSR